MRHLRRSEETGTFQTPQHRAAAAWGDPGAGRAQRPGLGGLRGHALVRRRAGHRTPTDSRPPGSPPSSDDLGPAEKRGIGPFRNRFGLPGLHRIRETGDRKYPETGFGKTGGGIPGSSNDATEAVKGRGGLRMSRAVRGTSWGLVAMVFFAAAENLAYFAAFPEKGAFYRLLWSEPIHLVLAICEALRRLSPGSGPSIRPRAGRFPVVRPPPWPRRGPPATSRRWSRRPDISDDMS